MSATSPPTSPRRRALVAAVALATLVGAVALCVKAATSWPAEPIPSARNGVLAICVLSAGGMLTLLLLRGRQVLCLFLRRPRLFRSLLAVTVLLASLVTAEGLLHLGSALAGTVTVDIMSVPQTLLIVPDPQLGYRLDKNRQVDVELIRTADDQCVGSVRYGLGVDGWRTVPHVAADSYRGEIWFCGGSNTFGQGLDDGDSYPARFAAHAPERFVRNLGVPGWGPHHLLALLRSEALPAPVHSEEPPVVVFLWIDHHLDRMCGSMRVRLSYGLDAPCVTLDATGNAVIEGSFRTAEPWQTAGLWLLQQSAILSATGFDWPGSYRGQDLDLAAGVFRAIAHELQQRHGSRMLIAQFPDEREGGRIAERLQPEIDAGLIAFCDLTGLFSLKDPDMCLDSDEHPTPKAAKMLGERVAQEVGRAFGFKDLAGVFSQRDATARLDPDREPMPKTVSRQSQSLPDDGGRVFR